MLNVLNNVSYDSILLPLALILLLGKILQVLCKKVGLPQVLGLLLAGIIIGLINYIPGQTILTDSAKDGISFISKIGVILIMFSAGLETDIKKVKETGVSAIVITVLGVVVPLLLGFIVATLFNGGFSALSNPETLYSNLFYGTILTATSVSVTVATLKELGKIDSKVGTAIVSAAIIDDVIGVILLSFIIGLSGSTSGGSQEASYGAQLLGLIFNANPSSPVFVCVLTVLCFAFMLGVGVLLRKLFAYLDKKYEHHRRIPIFGIAACFSYAWISEMVFGVADITGAFFCGLILANNNEKNYLERRSDILGYMLFTPVFFANVGIGMQFDFIDSSFIAFGIVYIIVAIVGKLVGCGIGAKITGFNYSDSIKVGLGMMVRAEVALICVQKGIQSILPSGASLVNSNITTFIVLLIVITSFVTPIFLKLSYKKESVSEIS